MEKKKKKKIRKPTLIEILAVLTILVILLVIFVPNLLINFSYSNISIENEKIEEIIKENDYILDCSDWSHSEWNIAKKCETGKYATEEDNVGIQISILEFNNINDTNNYYNSNAFGNPEKGVGDKLNLKVERYTPIVIKRIKTNEAIIEFSTTYTYEKEIDQIIKTIEEEAKEKK